MAVLHLVFWGNSTLFTWVLLLFCLMSLTKSLSILLIFLKTQLLFLLIFSNFWPLFKIPSDIYYVLLSADIWLSLFFIFFFLISLNDWVRVFEIFLVACITAHFPPRTAFAAFHRFGMLSHYFHLSPCVFWFPLWFLHWPIFALVACCLVSMCYCSSHFSFWFSF